jgi:hypothetical protein
MGAGSKVVKAAIEVLADIRRGALPTDEAGLTLRPSQSLVRQPKKGSYSYTINDEAGSPIGYLGLESINDGNARISDILMFNSADRPGTAGIRKLVSQLREIHPEITSISGERVSGVRQGGAHRLSGPDVNVSLPLPTDEASRMARAQEMGFDPQTYYHYSESPNIRKFDPQTPAGDKARLPTPYQPDVESRGATYFTSDPDFANKIMLEKEELFKYYDRDYIDILSETNFAATTYPVKIKTDKIFDYTDEGSVDDLIDSLGKYWDREFGDNAEALLREGDWSTLEIPDIQDALKDAGYRGYKTNEPGTVGLFYPDKGDVRSIFAKFDPAKSESGDILASVPAIATGLAGYGALSNVVEESN